MPQNAQISSTDYHDKNHLIYRQKTSKNGLIKIENQEFIEKTNISEEEVDVTNHISLRD